MIIFYLLAIFSSHDVGSTAFPILKIGIGPKAAALGEAYLGLPSDVSAVWWNPAGLASGGLQFEASHQEWFGGFRDEVVSVKLPNGLGLGLLHSSCGEVEVWNEENYPVQTTSVFTEYLQLGYGGRINKEISYGLGTKVLYERSYDENEFAFGADLGASYYQKGWGAGLAFNHLNPGFYYGNREVLLPISFTVGGFFDGIENLNILSAVKLPIDNRPIFKFGIQYDIMDVVAVRGGYRTGPQDISHLGFISGFTTGLGIKIDDFEINYAFVPYGELGLTHRIGVGLAVPYGANWLKLKVCDQDRNVPIRARVQMTGVISGDKETDQLGCYKAKIKKEGWIYLSTSKDGYFPKIDSVHLFGDRDQEYVIYLKEIGTGMVYGHLYDAFTKDPIEGKVSYEGPVSGDAKTTTHGSFKVVNLPGGNYSITGYDIYGAYMPKTCTLNVEPGVMRSCEIYLVKKREPIVLKSIHFETAKAELLNEAEVILDEIGRVLKDHPGLRIEISGHTDAREIKTSEFANNWELSMARANSVRDYLVNVSKIDHRRLISKGYADTKPIGPNTSEEGMAKNRRVEFQIIE